MDNMGIIVFIGVMIIGFVGSLIMSSSIQKKTGNDLSGGFLRKLFMVVAGTGLFGLFAVTAGRDGNTTAQEVLFAVALTAIGFLALIAINKKNTSWINDIFFRFFRLLTGQELFL